MIFGHNTQLNLIKSPSPSRVKYYQSPILPKSSRKILYDPNHVSISSALNVSPNHKSPVKMISISCINCQELISEDKIEQHSVLCTSLCHNVQNLENDSYINELTYKLSKLSNCLFDLIKIQSLSNVDRNFLNVILRICYNSKDAALPAIQNNLNSLSFVLSSFKGSLTIRLYADILQNLLVEIEKIKKETEIENQKKELEKIKEEIEKYKLRTQVIEKGIMSTSSVDRFTKIRRSLNESENICPDFKPSQEFYSEEGDSKELRKHFYSLFLMIKMKQTKKIRTQNFSVQDLYKEAIRSKIEPSKWSEYITKELKNSRNWININKKSKLNGSMGKHYFECIVEEQHDDT